MNTECQWPECHRKAQFEQWCAKHYETGSRVEDMLNRNTAPQTVPCPIDGIMEPHQHTREEWWAWEAQEPTK